MKNTKRGLSPFAKTALCIAVSGGLLAAAPARADAISDLKAQIDALQKKVEAMSAQQAQSAPANAVTGGATPGSFKLPGSNTSVKIGGYVKVDGIFNSRSAGGTADQELEAGSFPLSGANEDKQLTLHARQTRLNIGTSTPSAMGEVKTFLEGDFFGASGNERVSNSHGFRLRHAFGSIGGLLIGQTWSNYMILSTGPEVLDFGGPVGSIFVRQAQVRWTQPFSGGSWSVSLENPETAIGGTLFGDDRVPDVVGRVDFKTSAGTYTVSGLARQLRIDTPTTQDSKWGAALGIAGVIPVGKDTFTFTTNYGNVLGRYAVGFFLDGAIDPATNKIDLSNQWIAMASYSHAWTGSLRSAIAVSGLRADYGPGVAATTDRSAQSLHLNLIWSPVKNANIGVEYMFGRRQLMNEQVGVLNRIQTSAQYNF